MKKKLVVNHDNDDPSHTTRKVELEKVSQNS